MMALDLGVRTFAAAALFVAAFALPAGGEASGRGVEKRLQDWLDKHDSLRARFSQSVFDENGRRISASAGTVTIRRPLQFRWNYDEPERQVIVSDGVTLWWYDADLEQVTVKPIRPTLGGTPAVFLARSRTIEESFRTKVLSPSDGFDWIEMTPRDPEAAFQELRVGMVGEDLRRIEMVDGFGQTTRVEFSSVEYQPRIEEGLFRFTPPPGVDVIRGE